MTIAHSERLIVVVGPSGAGKDSVLQAWRAQLPAAAAPQAVRRVITRPDDPSGEGHEPVDGAEFMHLAEGGAFAFDWHAHGLRYGVRHTALAPLAAGRWVVMNGSRAHLPTLRRLAPAAHVVEITAPREVRAARLAGRGREDQAAVQMRLVRDTAASHASLVVENTGDLAAAVERLHQWWSTVAGATPG